MDKHTMKHTRQPRGTADTQHHGILDGLNVRTDTGQCHQAGIGEEVTAKGHEDIL